MTKKNSKIKENVENSKIKKPIPKRKVRELKELTELIKTKKTILIASIKNLPASQFQDISKKLRGKAIIKVPKKNIIIRAIDASEESVKQVKSQIQGDIAILFSDLDSFELASELIENRNSAKGKTGQIAPSDIEVQAGPTDLLPGPAVSELGALGLKVSIDKGKISIASSKIIVKKGEKITSEAAEVMNKLDIKPFLVGFELVAAFDNVEKKVYLNIRINKEETLEELKMAFGKALPFALGVGYTCKETITFLIGKAGREEIVLEKVLNAQLGKSEEELKQ